MKSNKNFDKIYSDPVCEHQLNKKNVCSKCKMKMKIMWVECNMPSCKEKAPVILNQNNEIQNQSFMNTGHLCEEHDKQLIEKVKLIDEYSSNFEKEFEKELKKGLDKVLEEYKKGLH